MYGSLHRMLQARIDSAQNMNYKILHISTVQVSWGDAIFEMSSNSVSKAHYRDLTTFTCSLKIPALFFLCSLITSKIRKFKYCLYLQIETADYS
jgi:hypothetical protein